MKKIVIATLFSISAVALVAQEEEEGRVKGGLTIATGLNFKTPETNLITDTGAGFDFTIGMLGDYRINKNIAFTSGVEFDFTRFSYTYANSFQNGGPVFVEYRDRDVLRNGHDSPIDGLFRVDERRTRAIYTTVPTMIKFQTNYMGYARYFGRFGLRNSFLMRSRIDFQGADVNTGLIATPGELNDMQTSRDMSFYRGAVGLSVGAEWNFAGSTSLVGELGYFYGFTNVHRTGTVFGDDDKNYHLFQIDNMLERTYRTSSAMPGQLMLRATILF
ncbi:MAG: outer membrane beta-barrel protein [Crocinitomicaceae bacterium]|nr:outer membrane beta-barrel protein [Crocinitomicaceae bacterium]